MSHQEPVALGAVAPKYIRFSPVLLWGIGIALALLTMSEMMRVLPFSKMHDISKSAAVVSIFLAIDGTLGRRIKIKWKL